MIKQRLTGNKDAMEQKQMYSVNNDIIQKRVEMPYREPIGRLILGDWNRGAVTLTHRRRVGRHPEVASAKD